jgi:3-deoxy-D-manno-octulosonate 8-phosphate phosphatase (KDO 8-P phosphatase)
VGGEESQSFHARDGQGLVWLARDGIEIAWISGRGSRATQLRAQELGVQCLRLHVRDTAEALVKIQADRRITREETVAMGDDLVDLGLAAQAALFAAPADADELVRARADVVTRASGGAGAVRELCEEILAARGRWDEIVERTRGER